MSLERRAEEWIAPYWNARHLVRTREWVLELDPEASEALRIAALTHDIERHFPGGEPFDPLTTAPDDEEYNRRHSERSARFVTERLRGAGAVEPLVVEVEELVLLHELGGTPEADLLQAADSLSFLELNAGLVLRWLEEGRARPEHSRAKLDWTFERIRVERARELALPLYRDAVAALERAAGVAT